MNTSTRVKRLAGVFVCAGLGLAFILTTGCAVKSSVQFSRYSGANYPATEIAYVQIFHSEPPRLYERVGEIFINPRGNPSAAELEQNLRASGASLGADGVVLISDITGKLGSVAGISWLGQPLLPQYSNGVLGVAVKFLQWEGER